MLLNDEERKRLWRRRASFLREKRAAWVLNAILVLGWVFLLGLLESGFSRRVVVGSGIVFGMVMLDGILTYVVWRSWSRSNRKNLALRRLATIMALQFSGAMLLAFSFALLLLATLMSNARDRVLLAFVGVLILTSLLAFLYTPRILRKQLQEADVSRSPVVLRQAAAIQVVIIGIGILLSVLLSGTTRMMFGFVVVLVGGFLLLPLGIYAVVQVIILTSDWIRERSN